MMMMMMMMTMWFAIVSGQMWFSEPLANIFWIRHMYSSLLFHCSLSYWCVLRREWMGCWGLLGLLLLVVKWIIPENSLPSTSKLLPITVHSCLEWWPAGFNGGSHRPERSRSGARTPAPRRGHLGKVGKPTVWLILISIDSIVIPPKKDRTVIDHHFSLFWLYFAWFCFLSFGGWFTQIQISGREQPPQPSTSGDAIHAMSPACVAGRFHRQAASTMTCPLGVFNVSGMGLLPWFVASWSIWSVHRICTK